MRVVQGSDITAKKIQGKWLILEKNKHYIRELNETAGFMWEMASKPVTNDQIVDAVSKLFSSPRKQIEEDVQEFLSECIKDGLMTVVK